MEPKTIGKFITALRKANGMTQKELAERLNVSDKTISRWERDEGAPDLSVIPVLGEIFGVTCDELLRGERRSPAEREEPASEPTAKGEKQKQRLLTVGLTQYRNYSCITLGLAVLGLLAAMICNLGFLRAYIGFFTGCVFYVAAVVCQVIFLNNALAYISDGVLREDECNRYRRAVIRISKGCGGTLMIVFAATLPLLLLPYDSYMGLEADSWFVWALLLALVGMALWGFVCYILNGLLVKKGIVALPEQKANVFWHNRKLLRGCVLVVALSLLVTGALQILANGRWPAWRMAERIRFDDYESFVAFMEQPGSGESLGGDADWEPVWYDSEGNEITEEEALREELVLYDGTETGKLITTFIHRNTDVVSWEISATEDGLPIGVITRDALQQAYKRNQTWNLACIPLYLLELALTCVYYYKKRIQ